ncbi:LysR family transcriptional regulator [Flavobacterium piscinae]|uniref:LysR family transcriptional regulator n=1 Tax=Flavobacterium piscinae TaxID=2506424 RepID=A0A4Q1KV01_9FLAO|nr:LysR family transcriptional regulator [Flavobacterium piscinae]RXR32984.1 LysR family transcriptional regulator [Flavobacterium piscinae]
MHYTLHQLIIFLKITETKSITKASEALHLTQPAVSIQLKKFQDQFDIPLTEVIGRQLYVTDFGKEIALAAQKIVYEIQAINYKTSSFKGQLSGRLKISVVSTGKYVIPYFITDFLKENSAVELELDVTNKLKVIESLQYNEVDFSLVSLLPENMDIEKIDLMENRLYFVGNKEYIFSEKMNNKSIIENIPIIYREKGSGTRQVMERFLESNKLQLVKKMELTSNEAVKQAVIAGLGCSIMPLIGIKNELNNGDLHIIPIKGLPLKSTWSLIWLKQKNLSPVATAFTNYLLNNKTKIMAEKFSWL